VLVSHNRKFIYTKTLKTAGTSVEAYFEPWCVADQTSCVPHYRAQSVSEAGIVGERLTEGRHSQWWSHMPAEDIRAGLGADIWNRYLKFCCIRNPYEKTLSLFFWLRATGELDPSTKGDAEGFETWLEAQAPVDRNKYMIDGSFCMDFVVRYERLHADLEHLCNRLGVPWRSDRLATFKSGHRPESATVERLYSARAKELVSSAYAFELDFFGYTFGGL
jgi:hypothetical protein